MEVYVSLVATIQAILAGLSVWHSERDAAAARQTYQNAFQKTKRAPTTRDIAARIRAVLPQNVAQTFRDNIQKCWDLFNQCISGKTQEAEIMTCETSLRNCMCANLASMVRINGSLPSDLRDLWKQFNCGVIPPTS